MSEDWMDRQQGVQLEQAQVGHHRGIKIYVRRRTIGHDDRADELIASVGEEYRAL